MRTCTGDTWGMIAWQMQCCTAWEHVGLRAAKGRDALVVGRATKPFVPQMPNAKKMGQGNQNWGKGRS